ncbi:MAG: cache domain-containing protein [Candidatus Riflebacteria bacterium]|nr:cache domain-containing protein [Candidatus Riflebacteria bacterium]
MINSFIVRGILPTVIVIVLFLVSNFGVIIPSFERTIIEQKKEMIRELTNSAWNILAKFENDEKNGTISREKAQEAAVMQIQTLHYGQEMKDYFWVNDYYPKMVIHPYRTDLNGKDLSTFQDPTGKRLFVEVVETVKKYGAGYVNYKWQWKDDSQKIVSKLSYVKGFPKWNWIIGTGIYLDDVQKEIWTIKQNLVILSLIIIAASGLLLSFLLWEQFRSEHRRRKIEVALKNSEEKYRLLVESAGESIIMALGGRQLYANQSMLQRLGYTPEEFHDLSVDDVIKTTSEENKYGSPYYKAFLKDEKVPCKYESILATKDGTLHPVMLSISRVNMAEKNGFIAVATDINRQRDKEIAQEKIISELQSAFLYFNQPIWDYCEKKPFFCSEDETLHSVWKKMREEKSDAAIVKNSTDELVAAVTFHDFLEKDIFRENPEKIKISDLFPLPVPLVISGNTMVFEAFLKLEQNNYRPIVISDEQSHKIGLLQKKHVLVVQKYSPTIFLREISSARDPEDISKLRKRLPEIVKALVQNGVKALQINHFITQTADTILERMILFAVEKLGTPPARFAFLVMGSEGRYEQTLKTDQDNAIIYEEPSSPEDAEIFKKYFHQMGKMVCEWLAESGYSNCEGGIMAKNIEWCQPVSVWKNCFLKWIQASEAQDLLQTKIFFDYRVVYGDKAFASELQSHLWLWLNKTPRFFFLLARNVLIYQPPLGIFGNFVLNEKDVNANTLDIKSVMTLIVDFARIYALKNSINSTETVERLFRIQEKGILNKSSYGEILQAYSYLMMIRLEHQVKKYSENEIADNYIDPYSLTSIDQKMLKEVFSQISNFQVRLSYDFTGMTEQI